MTGGSRGGGVSLGVMSGRELTVTRVVHASPEAVWQVLTDLEGATQTLRAVTGIEVVAGEGYAVGTRWVETRRLLGREESQTMEVTAVDRPRRTVVESRSHGVLYRTVFSLQPVEEGTRLEMCFGASHPDPTLLFRVTSAVFGRVGMALTRKMLEQDLADIAARAESAS
jgi:uncharacterized protein YndB with AHSA1/START domain